LHDRRHQSQIITERLLARQSYRVAMQVSTHRDLYASAASIWCC
jgi:hypothetical protein